MGWLENSPWFPCRTWEGKRQCNCSWPAVPLLPRHQKGQRWLAFHTVQMTAVLESIRLEQKHSELRWWERRKPAAAIRSWWRTGGEQSSSFSSKTIVGLGYSTYQWWEQGLYTLQGNPAFINTCTFQYPVVQSNTQTYDPIARCVTTLHLLHHTVDVG